MPIFVEVPPEPIVVPDSPPEEYKGVNKDVDQSKEEEITLSDGKVLTPEPNVASGELKLPTEEKIVTAEQIEKAREDLEIHTVGSLFPSMFDKNRNKPVIKLEQFFSEGETKVHCIAAVGQDAEFELELMEGETLAIIIGDYLIDITDGHANGTTIQFQNQLELLRTQDMLSTSDHRNLTLYFGSYDNIEELLKLGVVVDGKLILPERLIP